MYQEDGGMLRDNSSPHACFQVAFFAILEMFKGESRKKIELEPLSTSGGIYTKPYSYFEG